MQESELEIVRRAFAQQVMAAGSAAAGFETGGWLDVTRLYRGDAPPAEICWVQAPGWSLAYR